METEEFLLLAEFSPRKYNFHSIYIREIKWNVSVVFSLSTGQVIDIIEFWEIENFIEKLVRSCFHVY